MMGYIFVIDFGRYINVNINHYRHGQTLTNLTGTNPIITFFLGWREYVRGIKHMVASMYLLYFPLLGPVDALVGAPVEAVDTSDTEVCTNGQ